MALIIKTNTAKEFLHGQTSKDFYCTYFKMAIYILYVK